MSDRLNINSEMAALDTKQRDFYTSLTDEEKRKFSSFLMLKWGSAVQSNSFDIEAYYLRAMNENVNQHFFELNRHPQLQWLLLTTISPDIGKQKHYYPKLAGRTSADPKVKFLAAIYPSRKLEDLEVMAELNDQGHLKDLARQHGWTEQEIKKYFS